MTYYELYNSEEDSTRCHIYVANYHKEDSQMDLCGSRVQHYVKDIDSLDDADGREVCEKCQRIYLMLRLAE